MSADFKATQLQREIGEVLNLSLRLELEPDRDLGEEYSFKVTEEAVKALEKLKASSIPIEIANTNKLAAKKSHNSLVRASDNWRLRTRSLVNEDFEQVKLIYRNGVSKDCRCH